MKYTEKEITQKAQEFVSFMASGDPRCEVLLFMLSLNTGVDAQECLDRIVDFANAEGGSDK